MSEKKKVSQELAEKIEAQNQRIEKQAKEILELQTKLLTTFNKEAATVKAGEGEASSQTTQSPPSSPSPPPMSNHKTESGVEHYHNCPTCHKLINEEAKKEVFPEISQFVEKVHRDKVKSMKSPVVCEGCGEIVERSEPKCPNCGSGKARIFS